LGLHDYQTQAPWVWDGCHTKALWFGSHVRPKRLGSDSHARSKQATNKDMTIVRFSYQKREKKEKHKQSSIDGNPTMICLYTLLHIEMARLRI
jgi:hypothetical protein